MLEIKIEGEIKPKARPRVTRNRVFSPTKQNEDSLAMEIYLKAKGESFQEGEIFLTLWVKYGRGDLDNYIKTVCDALQKSGVVRNDSQITKILAIKDTFNQIRLEEVE